MNISVTGRVRRIEIGAGTWALIADNGQTYELFQPPPALTQTTQPVKVTGRVRQDIVTIAMIGPILAVSSFEFLS